MKILGRTIAILAAALVVVGAAAWFADTDYAQGLGSIGRGRGEIGRLPAGAAGALFGSGQGRGASPGVEGQQLPGDTGGFAREEGVGREGHRSASIFGIREVIKNLVIMGVIVAAVILIDRMAGGRRRERGPRPPGPSPLTS